jgi:integrase
MGRDNAIAVGEEKKGDILSYGVAEIRALLVQVLTGQHRSKYNPHTDEFEWVPYTSFMGYVAAALFCGLRPEEIKRTPLSNLDLSDRRLVVTGRASKTNKPRVIELSPVATAWFRLWRRLCPEQDSLMPETFPGR